MGDMTYISLLPTYAASAWYTRYCKTGPKNLNAFIDEARSFAETDYASAVMKGARLSEEYLIDLKDNVGRFIENASR